MWLQKGDREETKRVCRGGDRLQYKRTDAFRRGGRLVGLKRKCLFPFSRKWKTLGFLFILTKFQKKCFRENENFCEIIQIFSNTVNVLKLPRTFAPVLHIFSRKFSFQP